MPTGSRRPRYGLARALRTPFHLDVPEASSVSLRLPYGAAMTTTAAPLDLYVSNPRLVRQNSGSVRYRVEHGDRSLAPFTVAAPQGRIVDLGTEFEVNAAGGNVTIVHVETGKVRVEPNHGEGVEARSGERTVLSEAKALTEPASSSAASAAVAAPPNDLRVTYRPTEKVMGLADPVRVFMRPRTITLSPETPSALKKSPPFTSERPLIGVVQSSVDGRVVNAAIACDQKLNGKTRIYLDSNLNGDLTDDPVFTEGEDFKPGQYFAAGLAGHNDALWLRRPVRVDTASTPPHVETIADQVEYVNRVYLAGDVELPAAATSPGVGQPRSPSAYLLLDTNSDGGYVDDDGSLGVWSQADAKSDALLLLTASPPSKPAAFGGYRWTLARGVVGRVCLVGQTRLGERAK